MYPKGKEKKNVTMEELWIPDIRHAKAMNLTRD